MQERRQSLVSSICCHESMLTWTDQCQVAQLNPFTCKVLAHEYVHHNCQLTTTVMNTYRGPHDLSTGTSVEQHSELQCRATRAESRQTCTGAEPVHAPTRRPPCRSQGVQAVRQQVRLRITVVHASALPACSSVSKGMVQLVSEQPFLLPALSQSTPTRLMHMAAVYLSQNWKRRPYLQQAASSQQTGAAACCHECATEQSSRCSFPGNSRPGFNCHQSAVAGTHFS